MFKFVTVWIIIGMCGFYYVKGVDPKFDPSTRMRLVLVPADAQVGSVIYRLRATDDEFDYPLTFELVGEASSTVKIKSLPCTKYNSVCQSNIILNRRLESGRYYDFQVSVRDTKGGVTTQLCSITATNFTTPHDLIFPHKPGIIKIFEDSKRGTELDYVIARKNPLFQKPVYFELWGSPLFAIRQKIVSSETTEGIIFLLGPLDFEKQAMYHLTILANDAFAEPEQDSRNIAEVEIVIIVEDVQDQPPVFVSAPPVTKLPKGIIPGDKIVQVHAEDGDKGHPREVRYGLVSEGNPFTSFFDMNETSGEIFLMRPLEDIIAINHVGDPILLTVISEELKVGREEPPALSSTVQLAFFLPDRTNSPPYFENDQYITHIDENIPQGTTLTFIDPYIPRVYDDDTGKNGVFSLTLLQNNGTFEIAPNVAERTALFLIRVRDNSLLDYEKRRSVQLEICAQELDPSTNLSAIVGVTVYINDVNDNAPVFDQIIYTIEFPENITVGTKLMQVHASDIDSDMGGKVRYTAIFGYRNTSLNLNAESGQISIAKINHGFDRELMPEYHLYVEACDNDGAGNRAQVPLIIKLIDVNDEIPIFDKDIYEFILSPDLKSFTTPAIIHATDRDATAPNNEVRYEIINGNYENKFSLHKRTGELTVNEKINFQSTNKMTTRSRRQTTFKNIHNDSDIFLLSARAYDLGVPVRYSTTTIRIYSPESRRRTITFVVPGRNVDKLKTEETLSTITGGTVIIHNISPLRTDEPGAKDVPIGNSNIKELSVVTATVYYGSSSVVDISKIQQRLLQNNSSYTVMSKDGKETNELYRAENKLLFWLLVILATLIAFIILILLLCCIFSWCPFSGERNKKIVNISKTEDDVHLVHREMANGKHTKSVQVAEWMGRREAWSAEKPTDTRTKSTRWEFHGRRNDQNLTKSGTLEAEQSDISNKIVITPVENDKSLIKIKNFYAVEDDNQLFHNSRTNLINDRDVCIEDIGEEHELTDGKQIHSQKKSPVFRMHDNPSLKNLSDLMQAHGLNYGSGEVYDTTPKIIKSRNDENNDILQNISTDKIRDGEENNMFANMSIPTIIDASNPQLLVVDNQSKEFLMGHCFEEQSDRKHIIKGHHQISTALNGVQPLLQTSKNVLQSREVFPLAESEIKIIHTQPAQSIKYIDIKELDSFQQSSNQSLAQELENSLRTQNLLLKEILFEKHKFQNHLATLDTQSLPGQSMDIATQTDREIITGTTLAESHQPSLQSTVLKLRRKARSENDDSLSDGELEYGGQNAFEGHSFIKRKRQKTRSKNNLHPLHRRIVVVDEIKRNIRTPIIEEGAKCYENNKISPAKVPLQKSKTHLYRQEIFRDSINTTKHENNNNISNSSEEDVKPYGHKQQEVHIKQLKYYIDSSIDDNNSENSIDSNANEIIIKRNICSPTNYNKTKMNIIDPKDKHRFTIRVNNLSPSRRQCEKEFYCFPENNYIQHTENERISRYNSKKRSASSNKNTQNIESSKSPNNKISMKNHHLRRKLDNKKNPIKDGITKSETDLKHNFERSTESNRNTSRYMDWYYASKKALSESENTNQTSQSKKHEEIQVINQNGKSHISELTKVSPIKKHQLLKEEIFLNKQHAMKPDSDSNHPLLQHSEYRFERENPLDVPAVPTKLSLYMYPETSNNTKGFISEKCKWKPSTMKENEMKAINSKTAPYCEEENKACPVKTPSLIINHLMQKKLCAASLENDHDHGILINSLLSNMGRRKSIADKKSVFSIAYDDINSVNKIQSGGSSPHYS